MDAIHIPETATETYLERLADNITRQIQRTQNRKVRAHLDEMLAQVYARLQEKRRTTQQFPERTEDDELEVLELTDEFREEAPTAMPGDAQNQDHPDQLSLPGDAEAEQSDVLLLTELIEEEEYLAAADADFSMQEQQAVKDRLQQVLQKVQERKLHAPEQDEGSVLADVMREITTKEPIDSADLSSDQEDKIKARLKSILEAVQVRKQQTAEGTDPDDLLQTLMRSDQDGAEFDLADLDEYEEDGAPPELVPINFSPLSNDQQFIEVCKKISKGSSLDLFKNMSLSEREQDILNALAAHLNSYKGLRKQQVFEMQHLTARSIHELDLIFKTYHIQGYLKAELTNVYNRLLNIRGRFSILLN